MRTICCECNKMTDCVTVSRSELNRLYAIAYHAGHHDTCESVYIDVLQEDMDTYHEDAVQTFLDEL